MNIDENVITQLKIKIKLHCQLCVGHPFMTVHFVIRVQQPTEQFHPASISDDSNNARMLEGIVPTHGIDKSRVRYRLL